ncbi:MAG: carboxypeptidase-like regulatory domain-containing protein [Ignavibacteriales bacterium]|nr:carboxypeptidase-like regulatory domain-containing protein [Ignavibacteriales bacterium]
MKKILKPHYILFFFFSLMAPVLVSAQSAVGKLQGKITDSETGEALIGATILIQSTQSGAATNLDGEYAILNIPPGNYTVRVSYLGYQTQVVEGVRVVSGITKDLDVKLKATGVEVGEVVVTADRPLFEAKSTHTVKVYDTKEVSQIPVRGVERVVSLQAGVVSAEGSGGVDGNSTVNIRGGRGTEVLYIVDGVPQNSTLTGENRSQVSDRAIEQISFEVGGYEAKYGQAQSGIVNITTRSGSPKYSVYGEAVTSSFTDDFGYNQYTATLSGPIVPENARHTVFLSAERGFFADADPSAVGLNIPSIGVNSTSLPNNSSQVWRYTGKTFHNLDFLTARFSVNINQRKGREYTHSYAKWNSHHSPRFEDNNTSMSLRLSKDFSTSTFFNLNVGYKQFSRERGDGYWFDNILAYGDTSLNPEIRLQGTNIGRDDSKSGVFFDKGRVFNSYQKQASNTLTFDADFFSQQDEHLLEIGGGAWMDKIRYLSFGPLGLGIDKGTKSIDARFRERNPFTYGYWIDNNGEFRETDEDEIDDSTGYNIGPRSPLIAYGYIQDRYELKDLVLNIGVRLDYLDSKADVLRDEALPFGFGDPSKYDAADFKKVPAEVFVSPRIGFGFPVTASTVFHAQWGKFIQNPRLLDLYTTPFDLQDLIRDNNLPVNTGHVSPERTTQYEVGFRQVLGDNNAALNLTAFYKNTQQLTNTTTRFYQRQLGGQTLRYYGPSNFDFGTVKGLAFSLDIRRMSYFTTSVNYTISVSEGTGSSTSSSTTATFRNADGEVPIVIAPLDFDQRHTGTINVGFVTGKNELGVLENVSMNVLASFNSGRPYTPLETQDLLAGSSNYGDTKGYVNSAYGPGNFLVNLKLEKSFSYENFSIVPYLWVENVFDADNVVDVYRSTGSPYTTGWLQSAPGQAAMQSSPNPDDFASDFKAFERDPANFGIPRQIRLGLKIGFDQ